MVDERFEGEDEFFAEDGKKESDSGLLPTRTVPAFAASDVNGYASVGVTMGDVGGVNQVIGTINSILVIWHYADNTVLDSKPFTL